MQHVELCSHVMDLPPPPPPAPSASPATPPHRNPPLPREREAPPRFAQPGTLEYEVASRWKAHYENERVQREELEQTLKQARNALQNELHTVKQQHQTMLLRQGECGRSV